VPTTLRLVANDNLQAKALGSYAAQLAGAERFAVVDDGTPYGKGLADDAAKELAAAKKQVLLRKTTDDKTTDFAAIVDEMGKAKVDVLVAALNDFQVEAIERLSRSEPFRDILQNQKRLRGHGLRAVRPMLSRTRSMPRVLDSLGQKTPSMRPRYRAIKFWEACWAESAVAPAYWSFER